MGEWAGPVSDVSRTAIVDFTNRVKQNFTSGGLQFLTLTAD
jgi:hypothetical protein